jgi:hypothetical protein
MKIRQGTFAAKEKGGQAVFRRTASITVREEKKPEEFVDLLSPDKVPEKYYWVRPALERLIEKYKQAGYRIDDSVIRQRLSHLRPREIYLALKDELPDGRGITFITEAGAGICKNGARRERTLSGADYFEHRCHNSCDGEPPQARALLNPPVSEERLRNFHERHKVVDYCVDNQNLAGLEAIGGFREKDIGGVIRNPDGRRCQCEFEVLRVRSPFGNASIMAVSFNPCQKHAFGPARVR